MYKTNVVVGVAGVLMVKVGELLRATKGSDSYPVIARRVSAWMRSQYEQGRPIPTSISAEQVRKIFEDMVAKPAAIYLEALAAVQHVPLDDLLIAAGYAITKIEEPQKPTVHIPEEVKLKVAGAPTRKEKIEVAFDYLRSLKIPMGSATMGKAPVEAKLSLIRMWESFTDAELLPKEII